MTTHIDNDNEKRTKIFVRNLDFHYGCCCALKNVNMDIYENRITALIGPSGCGKSTFLRTLNRMNDIIIDAKVSGKIELEGLDIYSKNINITEIRRRVGMVFQKPNPFPKSIYENMAYGLKINGITNKVEVDEKVERSLKAAALWNEVKDTLNKSAFSLSGGQQQRLCIARAIAVEPEVILMDEPCSALDPIATAKIEELMFELKKKYTIVIVTHNMQQASRVSDYCGFMLLGEMFEFGPTSKIFTNPDNQKTQDYITGRFG